MKGSHREGDRVVPNTKHPVGKKLANTHQIPPDAAFSVHKVLGRQVQLRLGASEVSVLSLEGGEPTWLPAGAVKKKAA